MSLKDIAVPVLCVIATLWAVRGCDKERRCGGYRPYPQPAPQYRMEQEPVQQAPEYYQYQDQYQDFEQPAPVQRRIIRRRVIRKTYMPIPAPMPTRVIEYPEY